METLPTSEETLTDELLVLFAYLAKGAQPEVLELAAALELSLSQLRALHVLADTDRPLALYEVAERMALSVAATGRAVDVLVRGGLLTRREDEVDRRVKRIAITEQGREAVNRLVAARRTGLARFAAGLSEAERRRLSAALAPILDRPEIKRAWKGASR